MQRFAWQRWALWAGLPALLLACAPAAEPTPAATTPPPATAVEVAPTVAQTPTIAAEVLLIPTATPDAPPTVLPTVPVDWTETVTVEGDFYVLGNPAAPILLIDYSDFL